MKKIISVFLMIIMAFSLTACLDDSKDGGNDKKREYTLNETATVNSVQIQATDLKISEGDDDSSGFNVNPKIEGKVYVGVKFLITNNSDEDFIVSSIMCFTAKCNNENMTQKIYAPTLFDGSGIDGTITPNDALAGWYCFDAPSDWTQVKVIFRATIMNSQVVTFVFSPTI